MIEVKHLTKRYGEQDVVHDLNFKIEPGKIYGFLGPNGAGKSTTMNMITGCLSMTEGEITVDGFDILQSPNEAKRAIGYLPENPPLYPDMTPREYLSFVARAKGVDKGRVEDEVDAVMAETHITEMQHRLIKNLSKGFKQRVGIAQAMLASPKLIILDEPTVGLDPKQIMQIRDLILSLGKTRTVLLSSHILAEISAVCDHVMILSHGRMVANGTLDQIRRLYAGDNLITLEVRGSENSIRAILSRIKRIKAAELIETEKGHYRVKITAGEDYDLREELFFAFAAEKCPILSMASSALTLEEVFLRLTADPEEKEGENPPDRPLPEKTPAKADKPRVQRVGSKRKPARHASDDGDGENYTPLFSGQTQNQTDESEADDQ